MMSMMEALITATALSVYLYTPPRDWFSVTFLEMAHTTCYQGCCCTNSSMMAPSSSDTGMWTCMMVPSSSDTGMWTCMMVPSYPNTDMWVSMTVLSTLDTGMRASMTVPSSPDTGMWACMMVASTMAPVLWSIDRSQPLPHACRQHHQQPMHVHQHCPAADHHHDHHNHLVVHPGWTQGPVQETGQVPSQVQNTCKIQVMLDKLSQYMLLQFCSGNFITLVNGKHLIEALCGTQPSQIRAMLLALSTITVITLCWAFTKQDNINTLSMYLYNPQASTFRPPCVILKEKFESTAPYTNHNRCYTHCGMLAPLYTNYVVWYNGSMVTSWDTSRSEMENIQTREKRMPSTIRVALFNIKKTIYNLQHADVCS